MSLIDESEPGSGQQDGSDGVAGQLDTADTLEYRGPTDPLDEGWSPPDREPAVHVPTATEEENGLSLDELLAAEEPDISSGEESHLFDEYGEQVGGQRAGRLVAADLDSADFKERDYFGGDIGIEGAGASAEEAAVHIIDPEETEDDDNYS